MTALVGTALVGTALVTASAAPAGGSAFVCRPAGIRRIVSLACSRFAALTGAGALSVGAVVTGAGLAAVQ